MNIFVTGVSSGLGNELTRELLSEGHNVWGVSRKNSDSPALSSLQINKNFIYSKCDISNIDEVSAIIDQLIKKDFNVDIVILNAGVMSNDIQNYRFNNNKFKDVFNINLYGTVNIIDKVLPLFQQKRQGIFIGISSFSAYNGIVKDKVAYPASKAALNMVFTAFRFQFGTSKIRFVTINIGSISEKKSILRMSSSYNQVAQKIISTFSKKKNIYHYPYIYSLLIRVLKCLPNSFISRYIIKR